MHKDHNIVKLNARTCCSCAFSGYCRSDIRQLPCAELMGVTFKKEFRCDYCDMSYCAACIEPCSSAHREYIQ